MALGCLEIGSSTISEESLMHVVLTGQFLEKTLPEKYNKHFFVQSRPNLNCIILFISWIDQFLIKRGNKFSINEFVTCGY